MLRILLARLQKGNIIAPMNVRPYEPRDRPAVREICCDTADGGRPVERFFADREVFADLITRYYTDLAPETTWVAEEAGQVMGYVTGCFDSRRFARAMAWRIVPATLLKALGRGTLWHLQTRQFVRVNLRDWLRGRQPVDLRDYPGHVHINLRVAARGLGVGERLMEEFLRQAKAAGVPGIHANVSEANAGGRKFFEKCGFVPLGRTGRFRFPDAPEQPIFTMVYGKRL
jgi:GNAT superfamily N-acetyltransferase